MNDIAQLKFLVEMTRNILTTRIEYFNYATKLLDNIDRMADLNIPDGWLETLIASARQERQIIGRFDANWDKMEQTYWDEMSHMFESKKKEEA